MSGLGFVRTCGCSSATTAGSGHGAFDVEDRWELRREIHAPEVVGAEVLDVVREQLVVTDEGKDVVRRVD